jgi:hypothetical protein
LRSIRIATEEKRLRSNDDRRLRPHVAGPRTAPSPAASQPAAGGEPVDGAQGWRVTRRSASPVDNAAVAAGPLRRPPPPIMAAAPQVMPRPAADVARSPRRVAAPDQHRRGISLLALAAAAVVVVFVLGLAALDAQRPDPSGPWRGPATASGGAGSAQPGS